MSNYFPKNNIIKLSHALILFTLFNLFIFSNQRKYNLMKLEEFNIKQDYWNTDEKYIYYLDIQAYNTNDENILQIYIENRTILSNLNVSEIDESVINEENYNIKYIETFKKASKSRTSLKLFYKEILIRKREINQKYFVVLVEPNFILYNVLIQLHVSYKVKNIDIHKSDIDNGHIFSKELFMDNRIEQFFKFNFRNVPINEANLIIYINDQKVSNYYIGNISSVVKKTRLLIFEKNSTKEVNHIVYVSLLGEAHKTYIQIMLDYHDLKFIYGGTRNDSSLYIERLNCNKDFYIFESYFNNEGINNHLHITPFYGDYELVYYDIFNGSNITSLFVPKNIVKITNKIKKIKGSFNVLRFSCKTASLLKLKYMRENLTINLTEGREITTYLYRYQNRDNIFLKTNEDLRYKFYFGIFGENEEYNASHISLFFNTHSSPFYLKSNKNSGKHYAFFIVHKSDNNKYEYQTYETSVYIKMFFISNQYYTNVIEGITKLTSKTKSIAFKLRRDIAFDYFIFKAFSFNTSKKISCDYELKIVKKKYIVNGKVFQGINRIKNYSKKEIYIRFSNPYDKYNSFIKEHDTVYLLVSFIDNLESPFPIYVDIRYYYNNSIINLENSKPKILLNKNEYKIFGNKNILENNKLFLNLFKCSQNNYFMRTYYENNKNIISEEQILKNKTILLHDNLYNNTKFMIYSNDSNITTSNKNNSKSLKKALYYENGDIYMNYFPINESFYKLINFTKDYNILYKDYYNRIQLNWNKYIENKEIINNLQINYSLYILPIYSPINSICQMSLIPPNISIINNNQCEIKLPKGDYKIAIIASVINKEYPFISLYDFSNIKVSIRFNIILVAIISISVIVLIIGIILLICCIKKCKKKDAIKEANRYRTTKLISMANILDADEQEIILNDDEEDENDTKNKLKQKED